MIILRLIGLEWIKVRGTGLFWLLTVGTLSVNVSFTILAVLLPSELTGSNPTSSWRSWIDFNYQGILGLLLPMFLVIICALSNLLEERNGTWKLLHTQPIDKGYLYLSKVLALVLMFTCAHLAFVILMLGLAIVVPAIELLPSEIPVGYTGQLVVITIISSLSIMGLMFLISYVSRLFIVSLLIGIMGFVLAQFVYDFELGHCFLPFALPIYSLDAIDKTGKLPVDMLAISLVYFLLLAMGGFVIARNWVKAR